VTTVATTAATAAAITPNARTVSLPHTGTARLRAQIRLVTVVRIRKLWRFDLVVIEGEKRRVMDDRLDGLHCSRVHALVCCFLRLPYLRVREIVVAALAVAFGAYVKCQIGKLLRGKSW
jgi:hypothetical protein